MVLLIASFFLSRDCGDAAGSDASFILVYVAPALAIGTVGSFKDKAPSTSAWIGLLIAVPLLAWFSFFLANTFGNNAGGCVGF